jgi:hypothetical protein
MLTIIANHDRHGYGPGRAGRLRRRLAVLAETNR